MLLIVDKNEKDVNKEIYKQLTKSFSEVIVANLPHREYGGTKVTAGDVNIPLSDGSLLAIERKTPEDFLSSIPTRHIFNQVEVMAQNAKYSVIIVTGSFVYGQKDDMCYIFNKDNEHSKTNWRGADVRGAITTIEFSGCPVIFCPPSRYCQTIAETYNTVNKPSEHQAVIKNRIITFPPVSAKVEFIAQLPGINIVLAKRLLEFAGMMDKNADEDGYGTIASALHWVSILSQVSKTERPKGWGPQTILTLRKFLGLESDEFIAALKEVQEPINGGDRDIASYYVLDGNRLEKIPF